MREPTPRSASQRRLDRVHSEGDDLTWVEVVENQIKLEREYAAILARHPLLTMSEEEILAAAGYDLNELWAAAQEFYPNQFGGEA